LWWYLFSSLPFRPLVVVAEIGRAATATAEALAPGGDTVFIKARLSIAVRCPVAAAPGRTPPEPPGRWCHRHLGAGR
jgi:hypothetical protein